MAARHRYRRLVSVLLVAVGLYLTNDFNRAQQELGLKGQRADRFVKAIDQLGQEGNSRSGQEHDDKLGIRLGGIYALETLMRDSPDVENTVIEVLCAFVRTHAPRPKIIPKEVSDAPFDVRAALTVLGRRPNPGRHTYLDFSNTLLGIDGMNLAGAYLTGAYLASANLAGANLTGVNLRGTKLTVANLAGTSLLRVDLTGADLRGADLRCTTMDDSTELPPGVARSYPAALELPECPE